METARYRFTTAVARTAMGAAWAYRHWPENCGPKAAQENRQRTGNDTPPEGKHLLYRGEGNRLECRACRKYAISTRGMANMLAERCKGSTLNQVHHSHNIRMSAGVTWCTRCGAFATRMPRLLAKECNQRPCTEPQKKVLRRLMMNMPPTTAPYLTSVAVDSGGVSGADNSHADEVAWRRGAPVAHLSASTAGCSTTTSATIATTSTMAMARVPTGRYARLPGGHLHHAAAQATGESVSGDATCVSEHRRPLHPPAGGAEDHGAQINRRENICEPAADAAWSRRLHARHTVCAKACGICGTPTRTLCRGCTRPLCMNCARKRTACATTAATRSSPPAVRDPAG